MMMNGFGMMSWGIFNFFLGLLLLFLLVVVVVLLVRWLWRQNPPFFVGARESALDILKKRYAGGEIGKEEFEKLRKDIE
jgi:putative membrane protein